MDFNLVRPARICERLVVVDGLPGCGKTMLSAVIGSLDRVEHLKYSPEIETYSLLNFFEKIDTKTATNLIQYQLDMIAYNQIMAREMNFRFSDLSSAFKSIHKVKYFKRLFGPGDEAVPNLIKKQKPVIHLVTHCLSAYAQPLLSQFKSEMLLINFHRNPLYMIKQNMWNMENLLNDMRDFHLYYDNNESKYPYFFFGQEDLMLSANPLEKAIYFLQWSRKNALKNNLNEVNPSHYYELTFESFVNNPFSHLQEIEKKLCTKQTTHTSKVLKREKIPRKVLSHGRDMPIYRRVNWERTSALSTEDEINELYQWIIEKISKEASNALDWLLEDYNKLVKRLEK